jgi:hypothetical protein
MIGTAIGAGPLTGAAIGGAAGVVISALAAEGEIRGGGKDMKLKQNNRTAAPHPA